MRTRTPERKEVLAERSRRWRANHPEAAYAAMVKWRTTHKDAYQASSKRTAAKIRKLTADAKAKPCADCGIQYAYYIMEFDHVRGVKKFVVAKAYSNGAAAVLAEIAKCDVVCSNCHRERTHKRGKQA